MEFDDFVEPEVGVAVVATAALASPTVRTTLRKGAVYGVAGLLLAGDQVKKFAKSFGQGVRRGADAVEAKVGNVAHEAQAAASEEGHA